MNKLLKILLCCTLTMPHANFASPDELTRKKSQGTAKAMMVQFLALLAGIALVVSAKDKEERVQAAANILSGLATVAQLIAGNVSDDKDNHDNGSDTKRVIRAHQLLLEQQEFADLMTKNKAELCALLTKILAACEEKEESHQCCDA